jgi:hypothetical protein
MDGSRCGVVPRRPARADRRPFGEDANSAVAAQIVPGRNPEAVRRLSQTQLAASAGGADRAKRSRWLC